MEGGRKREKESLISPYHINFLSFSLFLPLAKMSPSSTMVADDGDNMKEMVFEKKGCCFIIPCFGPKMTTSSSSSEFKWWVRMRTPENKERWWVKGWNRIREWSKLVVGAKWKTFIRRCNKNRTIRYHKQGSFHYDSRSYARNFDDGIGVKWDEDYSYEFSSRYASVPASAKSSMDLGKDGPSFM
ncbi:hypothetical protein CR513_26017, partial [Mucuna pruriens]